MCNPSSQRALFALQARRSDASRACHRHAWAATCYCLAARSQTSRRVTLLTVLSPVTAIASCVSFTCCMDVLRALVTAEQRSKEQLRITVRLCCWRRPTGTASRPGSNGGRKRLT